MSKFILLAFLLLSFTIMIYLPVPMEKVEYTLEQEELPFLKHSKPENNDTLPVQNAVNNNFPAEKVVKNDYSTETYKKNKIIYSQGNTYLFPLLNN